MDANNEAAQTSTIRARIQPKILIAALKAVGKFTSSDPARPVLQTVFVKVSDKLLRFVASDGRTLCYVDVAAEIELTGSALLSADAVKLLAYEAKSMKVETPVAFSFTNSIDGTYPDYFAVVPAKVDAGEAKGSRVVSFNALYLARVGHVQKALKATSSRIQFGEDAEAPMRADIKSDFGDAVVLVLPLRS